MIVILKRGDTVRVLRGITEIAERNIGGRDMCLFRAGDRGQWYSAAYLATYDEGVILGGYHERMGAKLRWILNPVLTD